MKIYELIYNIGYTFDNIIDQLYTPVIFLILGGCVVVILVVGLREPSRYPWMQSRTIPAPGYIDRYNPISD